MYRINDPQMCRHGISDFAKGFSGLMNPLPKMYKNVCFDNSFDRNSRFNELFLLAWTFLNLGLEGFFVTARYCKEAKTQVVPLV